MLRSNVLVRPSARVLVSVVFMLLALILGMVRDLGAQVAVGSRVRVRAQHPYGDVVGRVERTERGTIRIVADGATAGLVVPVRYIDQQEVRRVRTTTEGMRHGAIKGALLGAGAGVLVGMLAGGGDDALRFGAVGLGAGVVGGGVYGMRRPGLTWAPVRLAPPPQRYGRR